MTCGPLCQLVRLSQAHVAKRGCCGPDRNNEAVKVFVSSLIRGLEEWRDASRSAIETLGLEAVMAEDFGASPDSARTACLAAARSAEVMVLILGEDYGRPQASGFSATHEEYREARESTPVLAFVFAGTTPSGRQADFVREVQEWEGGQLSASFRDAEDLRDEVMRALYELRGREETMPVDSDSLNERAGALLPGQSFGGTAQLVVAVAGGPSHVVLGPRQISESEVVRYLLREALAGDCAVLRTSAGTDNRYNPDSIVLEQSDSGHRVDVRTDGSVVVTQPALARDRRMHDMPALIEEDLADRIARCLGFTALVLDHTDSANRISHVAARVLLSGAGHLPWRTRDEQEQSPHSAVVSIYARDRVEAELTPPVRRRPALRQQSRALAADLTAILKLNMTSDPWHR